MHGNLPASFGVSISNDDAIGAINSAVFDPGCPYQPERKPKNGHYLVLNVSEETGPANKKSILNPYGFSWIDPDGVTRSISPDYYCVPLAEMMPLLGPSAKGSGKVVLDVTSVGGTLIWKDNVTASGYEWVITV